MPLDHRKQMDNVEAIDRLFNHEQRKLSAWELDFLESIRDSNGFLTPKQQNKLDEIWDEVMQRRTRERQ